MTEYHSKEFAPIPRQSDAPSGKIRGAMPVPPTGETCKVIAQQDNDKAIPRKAVICFECGLISSVVQAALSDRCHHCSAYIRLDNIILHKRSHKTLVQTRGDVTVKSGTDLTNITIHSHNLLLNGKVSGNFNCSGTCTVRSDQLIDGIVRVHTLVVERKATVTLAKPAEVGNAAVNGTLQGVVNASGTITIGKAGKILGDISAAKLVIEEGGLHHGHYTKSSGV